MKKTVTVLSLFHELFNTNWIKDDEQYLEEIKKYENIIRQMIETDSKITNYIKTKNLVEKDILYNYGFVKDKVESSVSIKIVNEGNKARIIISSNNNDIKTLFKGIVVSCFDRKEIFDLNNFNDSVLFLDLPDYMYLQNIIISLDLPPDLFMLSDNLKRFLKFDIGHEQAIALRLYQYISRKNLLDDDTIIFDKEFQDIFGLKSCASEQFSALLHQHIRNTSYSISFEPKAEMESTISVVYNVYDEINAHVDINKGIQTAPILNMLSQAVNAKDRIVALDKFIEDPEDFVNAEELNASRSIELPELYHSPYIFENEELSSHIYQQQKLFEISKQSSKKK